MKRTLLIAIIAGIISYLIAFIGKDDFLINILSTAVLPAALFGIALTTDETKLWNIIKQLLLGSIILIIALTSLYLFQSTLCWQGIKYFYNPEIVCDPLRQDIYFPLFTVLISLIVSGLLGLAIKGTLELIREKNYRLAKIIFSHQAKTTLLMFVVAIVTGLFVFAITYQRLTFQKNQSLNKVSYAAEERRNKYLDEVTDLRQQVRDLKDKLYNVDQSVNESNIDLLTQAKTPPAISGILPGLTLVRKYNAYWLIDNNTPAHQIVFNENENIWGAVWSPNGKYIAYLRWNPSSEGNNGLFGSYFTGVNIVSTQAPYLNTELIKPGARAHTYLSWSPDSRYLSYVINDGAGGLEILDIAENKVILQLQGDARPVAWFSDKRFSYVLDGKLFIGTLNNPKSRALANDAENSICQFESPSILLAPDWSPAEKSVAYRTAKNISLLNISANKKIAIGGPGVDSENSPCDYLSVQGLGWIDDRNYLYQEEGSGDTSVIKSIDVLTGKIKTFSSIPEQKGYLEFSELSKDGHYYAMTSERQDTSIIDMFTQKRICQDIGLNDIKESWQEYKSHILVFKNNSADESIFDVDQCAIIGGISQVGDIIFGP